MSSALLAVYAAAAGFGGPVPLRRDWTAHAPRLAIVAWLALSASCVAAALLAAVALAAPSGLSWSAGMGWSGSMTGSAAPAGTAVAGVLLAVLIAARAGWYLALALARGRRERRAHAAFLAAAGRADHVLGAVVLDQDTPAVYCLPGRVVVSTGALAVLAPGQLAAALAHERAHLRGRHQAMLTWAAALGRAFPVVPLLARVGPQLAVLAEMAADDAATRQHSPGDLAAALVTLARAGARASALTAGGPAAIARVERLLAPSPSRGRARLAAIAALIPPALIACLLLGVAACGVTPR